MFIMRSAIIGLLAGAALMPVRAEPGQVSRPRACFFSDQFRNWRAPDARTIYIRVLPERYFRLDLAQPCPILLSPGSQLITRFDGKHTVCSPQDWDLSVVQWGGGASEQCVVRAMTLLSPDEVAALPERSRPQ